MNTIRKLRPRSAESIPDYPDFSLKDISSKAEWFLEIEGLGSINLRPSSQQAVDIRLRTLAGDAILHDEKAERISNSCTDLERLYVLTGAIMRSFTIVLQRHDIDIHMTSGD